MNRKLKITIPAILGIVVILFVVPRFKSSESGRKGPRAEGSLRSAVNVNIFVVKPEKLENNIVATGSVLANEEVDLKSETSGKITKIYFKEGSRVKKGDLLIKINDADLQAELLKANYYKKLAEQKEYRQKMMLEKEGISQENYDNALNELNTRDAEIQLIKAQIAKSEIRAPFSGTIGLKAVSEGSYISPSSKIVSLQNTDVLKIDFSIPEKYSGLVKTGNSITYTIQGDNNKYSAVIYAIEPKIDPVTRTLQIRAITKGNPGAVHPGSFARVELFLSDINNALMIPTESLVQDIKGNKIFVCRNGKAASQAVELGIRKENTIQVTHGLSAGDTVITTGIMQLKPGMPVKVVRQGSNGIEK